MDVALSEVRQSLFVCAARGAKWEFVVLEDGGCAVLEDGERVATGTASDESINRLMEVFLEAIDPGGQHFQRRCAFLYRDRRIPAHA
jgi:hypothetical protein